MTTNTTTAQQARESVIFVIEENQPVQTNYYDHVMASQNEVNTPRGVMADMVKKFNEETEKWDVFGWRRDRRNWELVDSFDTEEEADDEIFKKVVRYDFDRDDQRDTQFFHTIEECRAEIIARRICAGEEILFVVSAASENHFFDDQQAAEEDFEKGVRDTKKIGSQENIHLYAIPQYNEDEVFTEKEKLQYFIDCLQSGTAVELRKHLSPKY
jgi:hypothetical protein